MSEGSRLQQQEEVDFLLPQLSVAAHELKSPLVLIRQLTLALQNEKSSHTIIELAERIQLTTERALRLTTDLTRLQSLDTMPLALEPLNPAVVCNDVALELSPLYGAYGMELIATHKKLPLAVADRLLLGQILAQFASNALAYADGSRQVRIEAAQKKDTIRFLVRDYGPGLSVNLWRRIREGRMNPDSIVRRPTSSGLGIYIAQQFARAMGANIGVIRHRDGVSFYIDVRSSQQLVLL